jgi:UPF0716 protein FxsA
MIARLGCLFVLVPLVELVLLLRVGRWLGVLPTVALVAATGVLGAWLVRTEGVRTMARFQEQLARGELPGKVLMDGAAILVGGAFLLTPGVLTDVVGFALLLPPTRSLLQGWAAARLARGLESGRIHVASTGFAWGTGFPGGSDRRGAEGPPFRPPPGAPPASPERDGKAGGEEEPPRPPRPGEIIQ